MGVVGEFQFLPLQAGALFHSLFTHPALSRGREGRANFEWRCDPTPGGKATEMWPGSPSFCIAGQLGRIPVVLQPCSQSNTPDHSGSSCTDLAQDHCSEVVEPWSPGSMASGTLRKCKNPRGEGDSLPPFPLMSASGLHKHSLALSLWVKLSASLPINAHVSRDKA